MALNCEFAAALCLGIGEYEHEQCLPKAALDAESMARAFQELGCSSITSQTDKGALTMKKTVELVADFVLLTKDRMQQAETTRRDPLLVALFVASHGIHAHDKELPLIVPADVSSSSEMELIA